MLSASFCRKDGWSGAMKRARARVLHRFCASEHHFWFIVSLISERHSVFVFASSFERFGPCEMRGLSCVFRLLASSQGQCPWFVISWTAHYVCILISALHFLASLFEIWASLILLVSLSLENDLSFVVALRCKIRKHGDLWAYSAPSLILLTSICSLDFYGIVTYCNSSVLFITYWSFLLVFLNLRFDTCRFLVLLIFHTPFLFAFLKTHFDHRYFGVLFILPCLAEFQLLLDFDSLFESLLLLLSATLSLECCCCLQRWVLIVVFVCNVESWLL